MHACFNIMNIVLILCENCVFYMLEIDVLNNFRVSFSYET